MTVAIGIVVALAVLLVLFLMSAIKVAREYERGIVFRLGRLLDGVSDRARDRVGRNSHFVELAQILSRRFLRVAFREPR